MGTSFPMLVALYLRDSAEMLGAGLPTLAPVEPRVHGSDHHQLISEVGGHDALRIEWEAWWEHLLKTHAEHSQAPSLPETAEFVGSPALYRVASAHRGAAFSWAEDRVREHTQQQARNSGAVETVVESIIRDREATLRRRARSFTLSMVILPLAEPRAWFREPDLVLVSHQLVSHPAALRNYLEPILELLI
ncbi:MULTISPECIES: hypothetical protein [Arthrobacter]|uniref:Condensation domain-containing protein n=2 Tax=Arthrobacter TaxID=1663 RepID=A0ABU9KJZ1_9MICC|nr:hypothetical protein [Arthrobacter sp. YJM1]MDP5227124.1 hypothetical protein [Arthrobacter sp. YJM1]